MIQQYPNSIFQEAPRLFIQVSNVRATFGMTADNVGNEHGEYVIVDAPPIASRFLGMRIADMLSILLFEYNSEVSIKPVVDK